MRFLSGGWRFEPACNNLVRSLGELRKEAGANAQNTGLVGFSMGGHWAVWLSEQPELNIKATGLYYAACGGVFASTRSSYVSHFASDDPWVSASAWRGMEKAIVIAGRPYQTFDQPGTQHWYAEIGRSHENEPKSAILALEKTKVHFLKTLLPQA